MRKYLIIPLIALSAACVKSGQITPQQTGGIMFINASLNHQDIDVYSYSTEVVSSLTYPDSSGYLQVGVNTEFNLSYVISGNPQDTLVYGFASLPSESGYSFFFIDSLAGKSQVVTMQDLLVAPPTDSAKIRFANFSLSAPYVNFVNTVTGKTYYSGVGFAADLSTAQNFTTVTAGTYNFDVQTTTGSTMLSSLTGFNLASGGIYTFFLKGSVDSTGKSGLSIGVIKNM